MIELKSLSNRILSGEKIELIYSFITDLDYQDLFCLTQYVMVALERAYLIEAVFMVLKEILVNSNRANAKRVFFGQKNLDINSREDYEEGISLFKKVVLEEWKSFQPLLENSDFYIKLIIHRKNNCLHFQIANNSELIEIEKDRIHSRILASDKYDDIITAYREVADYQESAGLGIVMMILFLRSIHLSKDNLKIHSENGHTTTFLSIPEVIIPQEVSNKVLEYIYTGLGQIYCLPDSLQSILETQDPVEFRTQVKAGLQKNISFMIEAFRYLKDPGSIRNLDDIINSYDEQELRKIIRNLISVPCSHEIGQELEKEYEHGLRSAFISKEIGRKVGIPNLDLLFIGSLIHDMGKLILISLEGHALTKIHELTKPSPNSRFVEEVSIGMGHDYIGFKLAKKWNFPPELVSMIYYHQKNVSSKEAFADYVEIVYLSNMLVNYYEKKIDYLAIDKDILLKYNIPSIEVLDEYLEELDKEFRTEFS
ncbi:MAG: HDOD domain-containing protein [Leptospiraceae bacterium]|nr:HDOD domain-containing protein [Leptospiraceae bacterium]MCP5499426.1 HDOD domain-containing protein [Leptospiraceae bacterium]